MHHDRIVYSPANNPEQQPSVTSNHQEHKLHTAGGISTALSQIISIEREEDEQSLARKYVLAAKYYSTLFCLLLIASILVFRMPKLPAFELLFWNPSGKYILQRVLRL